MISLLLLVVLPAQIVCLQHAFRRPCIGHRHSIFSMQLSPIDEVMKDLKQLSILEVRSLSKEYGLDESLVKAVQIKNLESAITAMNVAEQAKMPSPAQTLKVSPLEKTVTLEGTVGEHRIPDESVDEILKYAKGNSRTNDIRSDLYSDIIMYLLDTE